MRFALNAMKLVFAAAAIVALLAMPAHELAPQLTPLDLALYAAAALAALVVLAVCSLQLAQFVLRNGGTDPQWLWFGAEPPGLEQLRAEARKAP